VSGRKGRKKEGKGKGKGKGEGGEGSLGPPIFITD